MERHYSLDELDRYAADPEAVADRGALERHLDSCEDCRTALADARAFISELSSDEVWHHANELTTRAERRPLVDLALRIEREDEEATRLLRRPLASPLRFLWSDISRKRRYRTGGVVRALCRESQALREKNTLHARNLAETAASIAEALPDDYYFARAVNHLRGLARKECANAQRYLGDLPAAHAELDRAERAYRRLASNDLELASVDYVRATVLWEQQRFDDALQLGRRCAATFARLGDRDRWVAARILEGSILCDAHDGANALRIFMELRDAHDAASDAVTAARIENNTAWAYLEIGDAGSAKMHLLSALHQFEELGVTSEAVRARWTLGSVALTAGNAIEAERRFRAARGEFELLRLKTDAALVQLDLVEALLVQGRRSEVPALCADLLERFNAVGMHPAALTAAAFLREAAAAEMISVNQVRYVRAFIAQVTGNGSLAFIPPPRE